MQPPLTKAQRSLLKEGSRDTRGNVVSYRVSSITLDRLMELGLIEHVLNLQDLEREEMKLKLLQLAHVFVAAIRRDDCDWGEIDTAHSAINVAMDCLGKYVYRITAKGREAVR